MMMITANWMLAGEANNTHGGVIHYFLLSDQLRLFSQSTS